MEYQELLLSLKKKGYSVQDIAEAVGCSAMSLYRWEKGIGKPCACRLAAMGKLLKGKERRRKCQKT